MTEGDLSRRIGDDLLGPVVHRWLLALDQHISYFDDAGTRFLFCARAGVRIRQLYDLYLTGRGRALPENHGMLWASRLALCKGLYNRQPERAAAIIAAEYRHQTLADLLRGLFRNAPDLRARCDLEAPDLAAPGSGFPDWLTAGSDAARIVETYLQNSGVAFDTCLASLLDGATRVVLIDSGWQGTGQSLLHHSHTDIEWHGLYLGRLLTPAHDPAIVDRVIGLLFQAQTFDPDTPETAITLHRHLFESLLEPDGPSIEEIPGGPCDEVARAQIDANLAAGDSAPQDLHFRLVRAYLAAHGALGPAEILARHQAAMPELARMLVHPSRDEALAIAGKDRSADFGKDFRVPVLITGRENPPPHHSDSDSRVQHALWPQGQIALEHDGRFRTGLQAQAAGLASAAAYFDGAPEVAAWRAIGPEPAPRPLVAIITRTKDRPLLLARAAESVSRQGYDSYLWVVVNDGGDEDVVRETIARCPVDRRRIRLVSHAGSRGMEAASNAGIQHVESDYILIHDDDDTLHPQFLEKAVSYLESPAGARYGGVATGTEYVSEEIRGDRVIEHERKPYMQWVRNIHLPELMAQNLFAPISFLYRRAVYDDIGGYNPDLPVLGDWYFNLEFLLRTDIKVLPEVLAYYHHRDRGDSTRVGVYSNSVIGGQSKHEEFASVFRNMFLRKYAQSNAVAASLVSGYFATDLRNRIEHSTARLLSAAAETRNAPHVTEIGQALAKAEEEADRLWLMTLLLRPNSRMRGLSGGAADIPEASEPMESLLERVRKEGIGLETPPSFDEELYLKSNPDVSAACQTGYFKSGYEHYLLNGRREARKRPTL